MIPYRIEFAKPAIKQLAKLPRNIRQRVSDHIETLALTPRPPTAKSWSTRNLFTGFMKETTG